MDSPIKLKEFQIHNEKNLMFKRLESFETQIGSFCASNRSDFLGDDSQEVGDTVMNSRFPRYA